jgi:hypothetical protein
MSGRKTVDGKKKLQRRKSCQRHQYYQAINQIANCYWFMLISDLVVVFSSSVKSKITFTLKNFSLFSFSFSLQLVWHVSLFKHTFMASAVITIHSCIHPFIPQLTHSLAVCESSSRTVQHKINLLTIMNFRFKTHLSCTLQWETAKQQH